jgi:hypothetical protein
MLRNTRLRLVVMLLGAIAAFSVVGVAASFQINSGKKMVNAEGETLVISCSENVTVKKKDRWVNPTSNLAGDGGFFVTDILVEAGSGCNGVFAYLALTGDQGQLIYSASGVIPGTGALNFSVAPAISVSALHDIHVLLSSTQQPSPAPFGP